MGRNVVPCIPGHPGIWVCIDVTLILDSLLQNNEQTKELELFGFFCLFFGTSFSSPWARNHWCVCNTNTQKCHKNSKMGSLLFRYDNNTAKFTDPPGGDGLYYFSTFLMISAGEFGRFNIKVNREFLCTASRHEDSNSGNDLPQPTCSGLAQLTEGKTLSQQRKLLMSMLPLKNHCKKYRPYFEVKKRIPMISHF